jgi:hypothetical protein
MAQQASDLNGSNGSCEPSPPETRDPAQKPKKKALIVGINNYPAPNALPSCVADAYAMSSLLRDEFGFEDRKVLLDTDASKANLVHELGQLVAGCAAADRLVFFFSGHGYRPVRDGVLESALVTQDAQFFEDSELAHLMKGVPPGIFTVITDACFSGGMEKLFLRANGQIEVGKLKRWISLDPREVESHRDDVATATRFSPFGYLSPVPQSALQDNLSMAKGTAFEITQLRQSDSTAILVSACLEDETAAASTSQTQGLSAFTYALTNTIGSLGSMPSAQAVIEAAGRRLREIGIKQTPMLKCPPQPAALATHEFILIDEREGGIPLTHDPPNLNPTNEEQRDADQQALARAITTILLMTGGVKQMQSHTQQKDFIDDATRIANIIAPFLQSKGYRANGNGSANKDWLDDAGRIAGVVVPIIAGLQGKGLGPNGADTVNKDWIDDASRIASIVVPIVAGLQGKGLGPNGADTVNKDWIDDASRIASIVVPIVAGLQSKGYQANGNGAESKDWIDDARRLSDLARTLGPMLAGSQSKGFQPNGDGVADKDWFHDVARAVQVAGPIVGALLQSKGYQLSDKGWLDVAGPVLTVVLQSKGYEPGAKGWFDDAVRLGGAIAPLIVA